MSVSHPDFTTITPDNGLTRKIAYIKTQGDSQKPGLIWFTGYMSSMEGNKPTTLANWAKEQNITLLRFDYTGRGHSSGKIEDGTISLWLEEAEHIFKNLTTGPQILVASSMGGWLALLLMKQLYKNQSPQAERIAGLVTIAPAWNMTKHLMWDQFTEEIKIEIEKTGVYHHPSEYSEEPYKITYELIEDGKKHLFTKDLKPVANCPIRILHGMQDPDIPWQSSIELIDLMDHDDMTLHLIKDGDHRLSRAQDISLLLRTIKNLIENK